MDCNKDEAIRTREMAEIRLQKNDFAGAQKLALKAQKLDPDIDNIIQLLTVCDVHCASLQKINGYEMDWYGILQIEQMADDSLIRKHYRKLALLLHPDKNKFPGAEAAFKLIGEAQRLLSDPVKRQMHDVKRRTYVRPPVVRVQSKQTNANDVGRQSANVYKSHFGSQYSNVDLRKQPQPPTTTSASSVPKQVPTQGQSNNSMKFQNNANSKNSHVNGSTEAECNQGSRNNQNTESKKVNNKRKRPKLEEFSEDSDLGSSSDTDEDEIYVADVNLDKDPTVGSDGDLSRRRSARQKRNISYKESLNDDELISHNDKGDETGSATERENHGAKMKNVENELDRKDAEPPTHLSPNGSNKAHKLKTKESDVTSSRYSKDSYTANGTREKGSVSQSEYSESSALDSESIQLPDPEFFTFEIDKPEDKFKVGQNWAVYGDDELPKYYVQIQSICTSPEFELGTRWLIPCRNRVNMIKWVDSKMPFGCGIFRLSRAEPKKFSYATFSHLLDIQTTDRKGEFAIFPKKGEVWALYKDWNREMIFLDMDDFEYEVVEVVNTDNETVEVLPLHRVSGRVSVFRGQESGISLNIPKRELLRFSHQIPSFRLTDQLNGTLRGFWELDPAAVPPALLCTN